MQSTWRALAIVSLLAFGCAKNDEQPRTVSAVGPSEERKVFGAIVSLSEGTLALDEAELLTGARAEQAARADGALAAGEQLDNDYYIRDPDHNLTTLPLAEVVEVRLLKRSGPPDYTSATETSPSTLAALVQAFGGDDPDSKSIRGARYRLTLRAGKVVHLEEVFFP